MIERIGGVESHVRFVLVLTEPGGQVLITIVAILIENYNHRAHFTSDLVELADVDLPFMPIANGLAKIDPVQQRSSKRLGARALFRQDALGLSLQEAAIILDNEVLGGIGADSVAVGFPGPLTFGFLLLALFQR